MSTHLWPAISRYSFFFLSKCTLFYSDWFTVEPDSYNIWADRFDALYILALWEQFHSSGSSCYPASEVCSAI